MATSRLGYGPEIKLRLNAQGVPAAEVRKSRNGEYVVGFFIPELQDGVKPAGFWANAIEERFADVQIIKTDDTVAHWRTTEDIIYASVKFKGTLKPKPGLFPEIGIADVEPVIPQCKALGFPVCTAIVLVK